jgi:hypothetical protein
MMHMYANIIKNNLIIKLNPELGELFNIMMYLCRIGVYVHNLKEIIYESI